MEQSRKGQETPVPLELELEAMKEYYTGSYDILPLAKKAGGVTSNHTRVVEHITYSHTNSYDGYREGSESHKSNRSANGAPSGCP